MKASTLFTFAATAGLAAAQTTIPGLSTACSNSLTGLLSSPEAACLKPSSLLSFFVGTNQSIPDTVNKWLSGLCSTGFCSNETLAAIVSNVTTGCSSDLGSVGADVGASVATVTQLVQEVYPTVRNVMCLKDDASNQLCVTETLSNIEDIVGKLSFSDLNLATLTSDFQNVVASASNLACTNCTKAAFTLISPLTSQFPEAQTGIDALCGANFIDGSSPDTVSQTAVNQAFTSTKSNGALVVTTSKMAGAVMVFLLSAFTLLG
ncbi:hypothetical protein DFH07DRAFT_792631 [Mycena maculata]|uniref:DUF7729 domain-containing protein n=1 Tax=Mycena maculata TaxID=230809 RepID=A0AAD7KAE2_9AGAR|nr:hypothetical protein DFH07DRAFT_792631 [Mycena maculata]